MNKCMKSLTFFNITNLTSSQLYKNAKQLQKYYLNDTFATECVHFKDLLLTLPSDELPNTVLKMYSLIIKNNY